MSWEIAFVLFLLVYALVNFVWEKIPTDMTAFSVFTLLIGAAMFSGSEALPKVESLLSVFANPAPLTIAAMFVVSHALERCGAIESLALGLERVAGLGYRRFLLLMILAVALISAFVNNTPVVVVLMPVVLSLSRQVGVSASKLLIPLSYASIFGGTCTAIGTSTNILVSGVLNDHGLPPLSMFELSWVGVPILFAGLLYLVFFGKRLLPHRETLTSILSEEERKEYITEAFVPPGSHLAGESVAESGLTNTPGVRPLEVIRHGVALQQPLPDIILQAGDRLFLACRPSGIMKARRMEGMNFVGDHGLDLEQIAAHEGLIVEGVISPRSSIVGKTIHEINFRQRYRTVILAIHRYGKNLREKLHTVSLEFGDTLLMMGSREAIENLRRSEDILLLDRPPLPAEDLRRKMPIVLGIVGAAVASVSFLGLPIVGAIFVAVGILLACGVVKPKDAYLAIEWRILILIYGMLGLGMALESTGINQALADHLVDFSAFFPATWQPYLMLIMLYVVTSTLTELLSNNATALLMAPIALTLGANLGVDPRPYVIAVCVASSASFATPIGYQTNTYVYSAGGYLFRDFLRIGIPLNLLYGTVCLLIIPLIWPFA